MQLVPEDQGRLPSHPWPFLVLLLDLLLFGWLKNTKSHFS